jgi:hypothetical protein
MNKWRSFGDRFQEQPPPTKSQGSLHARRVGKPLQQRVPQLAGSPCPGQARKRLALCPHYSVFPLAVSIFIGHSIDHVVQCYSTQREIAKRYTQSLFLCLRSIPIAPDRWSLRLGVGLWFFGGYYDYGQHEYCEPGLRRLGC